MSGRETPKPFARFFIDMVLGGATKKIQTIVELAEDLYEKVTELREELLDTQDSVLDIQERVTAVEVELDEQRVIIEAIAEDHNISVEDLFDQNEDSSSGNDP